jgi:iron complex outermembrane receptor protein
MELLTKVPGTYLSRFNQGIINTDVSIRGFAGDGSNPHVKLLIDGIPSNLHAGYPEMDQLFPLGIGSVQAFKGTSDSHHGLYNIAGNYSLTSRADVGETEVEATAGSYDTRELQAYTGLAAGKLTQNYFAGYREAEGYRDHTDLRKFVASGRWAYDISEDTTLALITRIAGYEGDAPGYLSRVFVAGLERERRVAHDLRRRRREPEQRRAAVRHRQPDAPARSGERHPQQSLRIRHPRGLRAGRSSTQ